jgi:hypothetical protein
LFAIITAATRRTEKFLLGPGNEFSSLGDTLRIEFISYELPLRDGLDLAGNLSKIAP